MAYVCPECKAKITKVLLEARYPVWESENYRVESADPLRLSYAGTCTEKGVQPYNVKVYCPVCRSLLCEVSNLEEVEKCLTKDF
jgi:Zn finger protein HypA/HybF involved in hydrogenase expression